MLSDQKVPVYHYAYSITSFLLQQIYNIFEVQNVLYRKVIPLITKKFRQTVTEKEMTMRLIASEEKLHEFRAKDKAIKDDIKV